MDSVKDIHGNIINWQTYNTDMNSFIKKELSHIRECVENGSITLQNSNFLIKELSNYTIQKKGFNATTEKVIRECSRNDDITPFINTHLLESIVLSKRKNSMDKNIKIISESLDTNIFYSKNIPRKKGPMIIEYIFQEVNGYDGLDNVKKATIFMESSLVGLQGCPMSQEEILKNVTDILICHSDYTVEEIQEALDKLALYDVQSVEHAQKILTSLDESMNDEVIQENNKNFSENDIRKIISRNSYKTANIMTDIVAVSKTTKDKNKLKRMTDGIQKKLYNTPLETLVEGVPDMFSIMRRVVFYSASFSLAPIAFIITVIVDRMIEMSSNTKNIPILIDTLQEEIDMCEVALTDKKFKIDDTQRENITFYIEELEAAIAKLSIVLDTESKGINIFKEYNDENYNKNIGVVLAISEAVQEGNVEVLTEFSIKNSMRSAKEKLRNATETMSAKEKAASKKLDGFVDKFTNSFEKALTLENREKVIKGEVLPNASKTIKLAIATGAAWAINPAMAVTVGLSSWAVSKGVRDRERQIVLDEIRVHLRIVERKIQQAEMNNDLDAVEQLMKLEGQLKREEQRIIYRQKAYR